MNDFKYVVGIDFSMSCPSLTIAKTTEPFSFPSCHIFYLSERVAINGFPNISSTRIKTYCNDEERFDMISNWAMECMKMAPADQTVVYIEGYAARAQGRVFGIGECTGLLKHKMWKTGYRFTDVPPTVVKKFGSGKGNSQKPQMYAAFVKETGVDLMSVYQPKASIVGSPVGDIVDSFYICKYGCTKIGTQE